METVGIRELKRNLSEYIRYTMFQICVVVKEM
jgi:hypothetical protein